MSTVLAVAALVTPATAEAAPAGEIIPGRYIVSLEEGDTPAEVIPDHAGLSTKVRRRYRHALSGFVADLAPAAVEELRRDPRVRVVEPDRIVSASAVGSWGLDRIDQAALPLSNSYTADATGAGVTVYVIDTGIRSTHAELAGRVAPGFSAVPDGWGTEDCDGHGTHVAGTIGGTTTGVAPGVTLVPVRVLDCDGRGSTSGVIAGLDWVNQNATAPAVANMSLGGGASSSLDDAVNELVNAGVATAVAAGNSSSDACFGSPARVPSALTIAATTIADARATYSNYGRCVDLFAPGSSIRSAGATSDSALATMSGTSMASPHVAGVAALYLEKDPAANPVGIADALKAAATPGKVTAAGTGSPNLLLLSDVDVPQLDITAPTAADQWQAGSTAVVAWSYAGLIGTTVDVALVRGDGIVTTLKAAVAVGTTGAGSANVAVPLNTVEGSDYRVRVTSVATGLAALSDPFFIAGPPPPEIVVTAPADGASWGTGSAQTITWTTAGQVGSTVRIDLVQGDSAIRTIVSSVAAGSNGAGSYRWTLPTTLVPGRDYRVRVTSTTVPVSSESAVLTITGPPPPTVEVVNPTTGTIWTAGQRQTVSFTSSGAVGTYARVELMRADRAVATIISSTRFSSTGTTTLTWTPPRSMVGGDDYWVRVTPRSVSEAMAASELFVVVGPPPKATKTR